MYCSFFEDLHQKVPSPFKQMQTNLQLDFKGFFFFLLLEWNILYLENAIIRLRGRNGGLKILI